MGPTEALKAAQEGTEAKTSQSFRPLCSPDPVTSPHHDHKDLAALRGPSAPLIPIRKIREESRQEQGSFLTKRATLTSPLLPHLVQLAYQSNRATADSLRATSKKLETTKWELLKDLY